jgi:hypothetical protein
MTFPGGRGSVRAGFQARAVPRPPNPFNMLASLNLYDNFPEMRPAFQIFERLRSLVEFKNAVDDWMQLADCDRAVHCLEHGSRTYENTLDADVFHEDRHRVNLGADSAQDAYQGNVATCADGTH